MAGGFFSATGEREGGPVPTAVAEFLEACEQMDLWPWHRGCGQGMQCRYSGLGAARGWEMGDCFTGPSSGGSTL